ncbi:helix-turn-helix domain-containing protein [Cytobacillus purgationiresistens]|uniref:XRE family transcriptional regulator of biofilm formation n=1 Tax=Cytobacillus purgationiresistens TaxID=863449 RepID=A0ABU0AKY4_9BACI|nr:helix-turn-helix transcriptional regulator [Cytobacillus purgationiresistens]MDQ0271549.1 XRE family transcriptional regulator of biofilm formation [Cytobacillus purgationiresistens]
MIGNRLKTLRKEKGYSINELAAKAEVSKSYISYIERGIQQNPSLHVLAKLANSLETTVEELLYQRNNGIDDEWISIINRGIEQGVTKRELIQYLDFMKYLKQKELINESKSIKFRTAIHRSL